MAASEVLHPLGAHAGDGLVAGLDLGIRTGFGDDWLRLGAVKIFADGSLVGRTAALIDPYAGDGPAREGRGYLQADAADLQATIIAAHRSGWQVATHAIGDLAIDVVLDAYERALAEYPRRDPRHRIEHFAVVQPRQVARAAGLGVIAVPQGRFATELGDGMLAAVGPDRHGWLYRQRSLLEAGMVLPGSSDRPVVAGAPLLGIADMVNRRTASGAPFNPGEAITAAAGAVRLHPRVGLRQPPGARQGLDRPGHARRPGGAVRGPHRRQPRAHRRPDRARHHRRRPSPPRRRRVRRAQLGPEPGGGPAGPSARASNLAHTIVGWISGV